MKRFQSVLAAAKARDINESDTALIVTDILAELFGYNKYAEITSEHAIRGTFCDLAVKIDGHLQVIVEVKAIGIDLKESHVKQAVDYAANQGVDWVVLTNGVIWKVFRVFFSKPITQHLVLEFDLLTVNARTSSHLDLLYLLSREGLLKSVLLEYHERREATNRFLLAALILSEPVLETIRRELRRVSQGVKVELDEIKTLLLQDVLKREVVEGEPAEDARRKVQRTQGRALRARQTKPTSVEEETRSLEEELAEMRGQQRTENPLSQATGETPEG